MRSSVGSRTIGAGGRPLHGRALLREACLHGSEVSIPRLVQVADLIATQLGLSVQAFPLGADPLPSDLVGKLRSDLSGLDSQDVESLVSDMASLDGSFGEHTTTLAINLLLAEVAGNWIKANPGRSEVDIYDPVCGVGSSLVSVARSVRAAGMVPRIIGRDVNAMAAHLASLNLAFNGFDADIGVENCLTSETVVRADIVVAQPPLGLSWEALASQVQQRESEGRYPFGLPKRSDATWLFASHIATSLRPGGVGATFGTPATLDGIDDRVRRGLVEGGQVRAVALLADRILLNTGVALAALVLQHGSESDGEVTFIDLRPLFEEVEDKRSPRAISRLGVQTFVDGLARPRNAKHVRRLQTADCVTPRVQLQVEGCDEVWSVRLNGPSTVQLDELLKVRYGPAAHRLTATLKEFVCVLSFTQAFTVEDRTQRELARRGWRLTRLSALAAGAPERRSPRDGNPRDWEGRLVLDRKARSARAGVNADRGRDSYEVALPVAAELVDIDFLAAWLGTTSAADLAQESGAYVSRLVSAPPLRHDQPRIADLDEIVVVLPRTRARQREIVHAGQQLDRAENWLATMRSQLWTDIAGPQDGVRRLDALLDRSVDSWASGLPFPVASALAALRACREPYERHRQLFNVWEAYMAFLATVLLSAIQADPGRRDRVIESIREDLRRTGLDYHMASLGTWLTIARICSAELRRSLTSQDQDAVKQVEELFGGSRAQSLLRLISADVMHEFETVCSWRNSWHGHGGAIGRREVDDQCTRLNERLEVLQTHVGDSWDDLSLIRAGRMSGLPSGEVSLDVEVCRGYAPPFESQRIIISGTAVEGGLYLVGRVPGRPVPLLGLVQMRQAPDEVKYTAYFFNRAERDGSRLVTYQYDVEHDTRVDVDLASLILPTELSQGAANQQPPLPQ